MNESQFRLLLIELTALRKAIQSIDNHLKYTETMKNLGEQQ